MKKRGLSCCLFAALLIFSLILRVFPLNGPILPCAVEPVNDLRIGGEINPQYIQYLEDYKNGDTEKYGQVHPSPVLYTHPQKSTARRTVSEASQLPALDGRDAGTVTPVKNQGSLDTCWVFTSLAAAESSVRRNSGQTLDFSEEHARFFMSDENEESIFNRKPYEEGVSDFVINYLMNEQGAYLESSAEYTPSQDASVPENLHNETLIHTTFDGAKLLSFNDPASIKDEIYNNGAVTATYRWDAACYNESTYSLFNKTDSGGYAHASVIVGWDDNFPKSNFLNSSQLNDNGAWLVKNSWGGNATWEKGDDGYFWMSYEDASIKNSFGYSLTEAQIYNQNTTVKSLDSSAAGTTIYSEATDFLYAANVFDISADEAETCIVSDIRFFSEIVQKYEVYVTQVTDGIIPSDFGQLRKEGITFAGWQTVDLEQNFFEPSEGQYAVIIKFIDAGNDTPYSPRVSAEFGDGVLVTPDLESGRCFIMNTAAEWDDLTVFLENSTNPLDEFTGHFLIKSILKRTTDLPPAAAPVITSQPQNLEVYTGQSAPLSVEASTSDSGTLFYQWFRSNSDYTGSVRIDGAESSTYSPTTSNVGVRYYYVEITNSLWSTTASATSDVASVTVNPRTDAKAPVITTQPVDVSFNINESETLSVSAESADGGNISYQWFSNSSKSTNHGMPATSGTSESFEISGTTAGTFYYYVQVTNTNESASGEGTASVFSDVVTVTILRLENTTMPTPLPDSEAINTVTRNSISITELPEAENYGMTFAFEYAISEYEDPLVYTWQTNVNFSDLKPSTNYYIFARAAGNDVYAAGEVLKIATVKTEKPLTWSQQNRELSTIIVWVAIAAIFIIVVREIHPTKKKEIATDTDEDDDGRDSILPTGMTSSVK